MSTPPRRHLLSEPKVIVLAAGIVLIGVLCVVAIAVSGDVWAVPVAAVAIGLVALAIDVDLRGVIAETGADEDERLPPVPDGRAIVMCTGAMTAEQVRDAVDTTSADCRSIMFVAPEGLGTGGLMVDKLDYERALQAETATVAALRRAGINAAGHVGDRNPEHAITDALALFPAGNVVIVARGPERDLYRRHLDVEGLTRRTGTEIRVLEVVES
jgi:hypothetical protein